MVKRIEFDFPANTLYLRFSRLAFIQNLRQKGPSTGTSTNVGPVAPAPPNPSVTSIRLISSAHNTGSAPSRNGSQPPAGSPPPDVTGKRMKKKKIMPGGTESESGGTPAPPTKRKKGSQAGSPEPLEMTPEAIERDRIAAERKKAAAAKRRAEARARAEAKSNVWT